MTRIHHDDSVAIVHFIFLIMRHSLSLVSWAIRAGDRTVSLLKTCASFYYQFFLLLFDKNLLLVTSFYEENIFICIV